ncbi:hypothetical protein [Legionella cardiaca]|uniref:ABC transmembrane type-1 domain-containing protein n=1 Tax=Legionella cardiaca TaxID=1071983 RepID=A0ABY8AUF9_9GAMM|nr:hypothetical protein [Legionella cardiaca]WED44313.1 hypothetical protein PXX05_05870 [Legionella cardiaca]
MRFSFNPFAGITESEAYPASRIQRRTFWEKLKDTFSVIAGQRAISFTISAVWFNDRRNKIERPGILDYLTFQITRIANKLAWWSVENFKKEPIALLTLIPSAIAFLVFNTVHYSLATLLTLIASPIVLAVHVYSEFSGARELQDKAGQLQGEVEAEYATRNVQGNSLSAFMKGTGHTYSDVIFDLKKASGGKDYTHDLLVMEDSHKFECCIDGHCRHQKGHIQFQAHLNLAKISEQDKESVRALIKLNAGSLRDNLIEDGGLEEIESLVATSI